jgi:hypothetical protein
VEDVINNIAFAYFSHLQFELLKDSLSEHLELCVEAQEKLGEQGCNHFLTNRIKHVALILACIFFEVSDSDFENAVALRLEVFQ